MKQLFRIGACAALILGAVLGTSASAQSPKGPISDGGPEASLSKVFKDIEARRLDSALERVDALLAVYPNFRLAHLIRGDLLLARSRPLTGFGNAPTAPPEKVAELRDEAIARLQAYHARPTKNQVPRYLLQMRPDQKYAIVVDTKKSRLYLYANERGRPRFVADYYITHGKEGAKKSREGDKRTPLGVYHVVSEVPKKKLTDFYGSGAFPINYPNEYDRLLGRAGHGIWLHGVPRDTMSRPPKASDGCVVLANADLQALASRLQLGLTPVIISDEVEWLSLDDWQQERSALQGQIEAWRRDWESGDTERYLQHYAEKFTSDSATRTQWGARKRAIAKGKTWVQVRLDNISMFRDPGQEEMVVVTFDQDYRSNNLKQRDGKRQYWIKEGGKWKILYEGQA
ncbi:L,D-transpeptidase family protein [Niveibacterium sp. 24ML]|uniref:L,D-transpeptidase family protein n=1 Tax=Niveibacterium sp. 24ML TaxID=2985512 RepID=UPI00226E3512|nr:L,D-transpeptidase family protein [Niveibacterium sp. 24ML]MCX9155148.1 L,D-transpeptidase family protein [Niveibacterium sp. 24ML]